jgi:hypothetical protein
MTWRGLGRKKSWPNQNIVFIVVYLCVEGLVKITKTWIMIVSLSAEILTQQLPNVGPECCCYITLLAPYIANRDMKMDLSVCHYVKFCQKAVILISHKTASEELSISSLHGVVSLSYSDFR